MKVSRIALALVSLSLALPALMAGEHLVNIDKNKVALQGYDPVSFFTDGKPVKGDPAITFDYHDAKYHFASEEHKEMFAADPDKYEPKFGGYCAYGVAVGGLYPIDVEAFNIYEGQLLLQKNKDVRDLFNKDPEKNYEKAVKNWPKLQEKKR